MPLMEAGLDSIGAVKLRNAVSARFGMELPAMASFDYPTTHALAAHVAARAGPLFADRAQGSAGEGLQEQGGWSTDGGMAEIVAELKEIVRELLGAAVPDDQVHTTCCPLKFRTWCCPHMKCTRQHCGAYVVTSFCRSKPPDEAQG